MNVFNVLRKWFGSQNLQPHPTPNPAITPDSGVSTPANSCHVGSKPASLNVSLPEIHLKTGGHAHPVESFDPHTGKTVKQYPSLHAAKSNGYQRIKAVLTGRAETCGSLGWRYVEASDNKRRNYSRQARPVEALDPATGQVSHYHSLNEAHRAGYNIGAISEVLAGRRKHHAGLKWRYTNGMISTAATKQTQTCCSPSDTLRNVELGSLPAPTSTRPADLEAEALVLTDAHRKDTLRRLREAIFHDPSRDEFGVRFPDGRILYRPSHAEAVALWYAEDARTPVTLELEQTRKPTIQPACAPQTTARKSPKRSPRPVEAIDPTTGEVRHHFSDVATTYVAGFNANAVYNVLAGRQRTHRGLVWRDAMPESPPSRRDSDKAALAWALVARLPQQVVESFNQATGEVQTVFHDPAAVVGAGLPDVLSVLEGQAHHAYGLGWRYRVQKPQTLTIRRPEVSGLQHHQGFGRRRAISGCRLGQDGLVMFKSYLGVESHGESARY